MNIKFTPLNAFRLFVIICLLTSAVILPANGATAVLAQPLFSEETPAVYSGSNDESTPTPEVTETPVPEVTEEITQTPDPEITEEVTPTPEPEVTEEVTETPTPDDVIETPVPDEQITEEPPVEVVDGQSAEVCASLPVGNSKTECEALVALYQSTNGAGWLRKTSWLTSTPHCEWYGISCHDSGRVKEIQLSSNKLSGSLPAQIGNFSQLEVLSVQNNAIGGVIPSEIGNLTELKILLISFNSIGGSIPTTFGQLTKLERVEISRNKLTGSIPNEIGGMTGLKFFWGYDNQLTGPIPSTINNLTALTTFHFSDNQLSGAIPDLSAISNLGELKLANNQLTGSIPSSILKKGTLVDLNLSNNAITGSISVDFSALKNLQALNLSGNQLTGPIPASLGGLTNLKYLNLGSNPLGGTIPSQLGNLTNLKELYLNSNELTGKSWPAWLNTMTQLERLNLSNNFELGGPIPPEIGNLVNLRLLDISRNHFWGEIPLDITKLTKLNIKAKTSDARAYTDIGHNHLTSKNTKVRDFLSKKDPDWEKTQTPANPIPVIQSLNPPYVIIGTSTMVLQVRGKSMMDGAVVYLNGVPKSTTFVNNFTLEIEVPGDLMATENVLEITAKNPWPSVNESAVYKFYVSDLMPAVGSTVLSRRPSFLWYTVTGADLYEFQISTYKNFSQSVTKLTSATNSLIMTKDLPLNKMMYWRVRGRVGGVYQGWSDVYYFRSSNSPGVAALSSPGNNALTTNYVPKLVWKIPTLSSGTVFEKYQVQVSSDPTFAPGTFVVDEDLTIRSKPTYTIPLGVLLPNTQYYWRVRTFNTWAHESNWSTSRIIRSAMLPPVLTMPELGSTALTPRPLMKWATVTGATSYQIQFSTSSTFGTLLQSGKPTGTEFTPTKNLPQNRIIHWRVRAIGPNGPSLWTKSSFRSANPPSTPSLSLPANNALITNYSPTLKWGVSSLPSGTTFKHYIVQISKSKDFPDGATTQYPPITIRTQNTLQVGPLDPNTRYYWRVYSENTANQYSTWSSVRSFRAAMLPVQTLNQPVQDSIAESPRPNFEWSPVVGAKSYTIQLSLQSNFSTLIRSNVTNTTSFVPPADLVRNKTIHWRVRANGDNGPTLWTTGSFTSANAPSTPSLLAPSNGVLITENQALLKWNASSVPTGTIFKHYKIDIATNSAFTENLASYTTIDLFYPLNLQPNTRYYWRVQGWNDANQYSTWSAVRNFRSAMIKPVLLLPAQDSTAQSRRPEFTWNPVPGATSYTVQLSLNSNFSSLLTSGTAFEAKYTPSISLVQNKVIYWRVRANGLNGPSLWSDGPRSFISANPPSTPSLVSPADGAILKTLQKLDWSNSNIPAGTTFSHYQVEVASNSTFSIIAFEKETIDSEWNDWGSVSPLNTKTKYYWRVRAVNSEGHMSNWSSRRSFTSP